MPRPSKRLDEIPPYLFAEISRLKAEMRAKGEDIVDLGIGDPDQPTPAGIIQVLHEASKDPTTHTYDDTPRGWGPFLDAASDWYARTFGVRLNKEEHLMEVIGSKEGLAHLIWAFCDPGDVVLVPDPGYPVYEIHAKMAGADVVAMPLRPENDYLPDFDEIDDGVADRTKLMFLCYPSNPTGATASLEFYETAVDFCRKHDILLVADMAYCTVSFDGYRAPSPLQVPGAKDCVIEFHSLSKMFNMTGWRIGFAGGNPAAIAALAKFKENTDSKQFPAIAQAGAWALLNERNEETMKLYRIRRDALVEGLNEAGWEITAPVATFYVWARVPTSETSKAFSRRLLEEAKVLVIPGNGYGREGEGFVRMSLTVSGDKEGERLAEAARRIASCGLAVTK